MLEGNNDSDVEIVWSLFLLAVCEDFEWYGLAELLINGVGASY